MDYELFILARMREESTTPAAPPVRQPVVEVERPLAPAQP